MKKAVLIMAVSVMLLLSACGSGGSVKKVVFTTGFSNKEVFRIEDMPCSLSEAMVYLVNTQKGYEQSFGSEIWQVKTDDGTVEERLKESVLAKIAQIKAMNLLAAESGIELEEEEILKTQEAAQEYYSSLSEADIAAMNNVTQKEIENIYVQQALADKLYDSIIKDINPEVSDDEARIITVAQIFTRDQDKARRAQSLIYEGNSFEDVATLFNEADEGTISFGKGERDSEFENAAFNLGNEEVSGIIKSGDGYVILKCISTFNRDETEENKIRIVEQRKKEAFGAKYDDFVASLTKELNTKLWDSVSLVDDENVTTTSLLEVYNKYFG